MPTPTDDPAARLRRAQMATDASSRRIPTSRSASFAVASRRRGEGCRPGGSGPAAASGGDRRTQDRRSQGQQLSPPVRHDLGRHLCWRHARQVAPQQCRLGVVVGAQEEVRERDPGRVRQIPEHFGDAVRLVRPLRRASGGEQVEAGQALGTLGRDAPGPYRVEVIDGDVAIAIQDHHCARSHHVVVVTERHTQVGDHISAQRGRGNRRPVQIVGHFKRHGIQAHEVDRVPEVTMDLPMSLAPAGFAHHVAQAPTRPVPAEHLRCGRNGRADIVSTRSKGSSGHAAMTQTVSASYSGEVASERPDTPGFGAPPEHQVRGDGRREQFGNDSLECFDRARSGGSLLPVAWDPRAKRCSWLEAALVAIGGSF